MASTSKAIVRPLRRVVVEQSLIIELSYDLWSLLQGFLLDGFVAAGVSEEWPQPEGNLRMRLHLDEAENLLAGLRASEVSLENPELYERFYIPLLEQVKELRDR